MANPEHLAILKQGVEAWNAWRREHSEERPDLSRADLSGADFLHADFRGADLTNANLTEANLVSAWLDKADLSQATLIGANLNLAKLTRAKLIEAQFNRPSLVSPNPANLSSAQLDRADLTRADLSGVNLFRANLQEATLTQAVLADADIFAADLRGARLPQASLRRASLSASNLSNAILEGAILESVNLSETNLTEANLRGADLSNAVLVRTRLLGADLSGARTYGVAVWDIEADEKTKQRGLIITPHEQPSVTVDDVEFAQFLYLLLNNEKIRGAIDTITSKVVLILGRFSTKRKAVLDAIREELRKAEYDYVPVVFDFDKPASRDLEETITLLARMARFIIADITNAKSIPQELAVIVKDLPSVPVQPILRKGAKPWAMFGRIQRYPWVLPLAHYVSKKDLLPKLGEKVVRPAEDMVAKQRSSADA